MITIDEIEELEYLVQQISKKLTPQEQEIAMINEIKSAIDHGLYKLFRLKIEEQNNYISSKFSADKLLDSDFEKFYNDFNWVNEQAKEKMISRLTSSNFEYPTLELFPGNGKFTVFALPAEPLYIADYNMELLSRVGNIFNEFYNHKRLMKYAISDFDLSELPQNQFGSVISLNYFIVKNEDFIIDWAKEIIKVLRPGGSFLFNFIPSSTADGIRTVEEFPLTAINPISLNERLMEIGYATNIKIEEGMASTVMATKAGELSKIKMSSTLVRIIEKP